MPRLWQTVNLSAAQKSTSHLALGSLTQYPDLAVVSWAEAKTQCREPARRKKGRFLQPHCSSYVARGPLMCSAKTVVYLCRLRYFLSMQLAQTGCKEKLLNNDFQGPAALKVRVRPMRSVPMASAIARTGVALIAGSIVGEGLGRQQRSVAAHNRMAVENADTSVGTTRICLEFRTSCTCTIIQEPVK